MTMTVNSQHMLLLNRKRAAYEINRDIHVFYLLAVSIASNLFFLQSYRLLTNEQSINNKCSIDFHCGTIEF